jgi:hypothetical protein
MKKALIGLLILAIAGGLFAQELNWTGTVRTGFQIDVIDGADDIGIYATDDDVPTPVKARLGLTYTDGPWGLKLGTGANIGSESGTSMFVHNAYGWMDFVDGMLNIKAGLIDDNVWDTGGEYDDGVATGGGVRLEILPIEGLNLGAFFTYPDPAKVSATKIANFFQETAFGFSFDGGIFDVAAAIKLHSEECEYTSFDGMDMRLVFAFGFTGIPGLTLRVDGGVEHLAKYSDAGEATIWEEVDFALGPLSVGLHARELLLGYGDIALAEVEVKPLVEYAVSDSVSVGADVPVVMADIGDGLGLGSFGVNAWCKYSLGGAWLKAGYGFTSWQKDYGVDFEGGDAALNHYIRLIFEYSF